MQVYREIGELAEVPGAVHLAIGVFDGVHVGHQRVIRRAIDGAERDGGSAVVVTFDPHPARVLRPERAPVLLTPGEQQERALEWAGVERVLMQRFDKVFADVEGEDFVGMLVEACRPLKHIVVGYDWRFGKGRRGDIHLLAELGERWGFEFTAVPAVKVGEVTVRSTLVRDAVRDGALGRAREFLGRDYMVAGTVVEGEKMGGTLGFPTANVDVENELMPPVGVYAVRVRVDGIEGELEGVANYGLKPTIPGERAMGLEVHVLDWEGDLYGKRVEVGFVGHIRDEVVFDGVEALKAQIGRDVETARGYLGGGS